MPKRRFFLAIAITACAPARPASAPQPSAPAVIFDLIIRNGTIIDGTGAARYRDDVGIANGRIARIGDLSAERATQSVDARGLIVAPGFINIHSHATGDALPTAVNMLTQGVTTEIFNADGGGPTDIARQLSQVEAAGLAVNAGAYIGFNSLWTAVVGRASRRATDDEIARMRAMLVENLERGAWGVSAGLDYVPGYYATTDEVIKVVSAAAKWRTNFPNHDRLTPETQFSAKVGIAETIAIGERAGLAPVITHMKAQGAEQRTGSVLLGMMQDATRRGHYTAADVYPYLAGMTGLGALTIPRWVWEGTADEISARLRNPEVRARAVAEGDATIKARFNGVESIYLPATREKLVDVMRQRGMTSAAEAILKLSEEGKAGMAVLSFGAEEDLVKFLQHPTTAISCDCGARRANAGHPREYGTFPRVLGHYVRESHVLTWESAIRKMTGLPATIVGIVDRGFLVPGMAADLVVFDSATVTDRATYEKPLELSEGIRYVIVNGHVALRDGVATGERGGRALRRTPHMPTRPMSVDVDRRVAASGKVGDEAIEVVLDVSQKPGQRRPSGTLRLTIPSTNTVVEMRDLGLLQTSNGWATVTGRARLSPSGDDRSVTVIVEQADPFVAGGPATITIDIEGLGVKTGVLSPNRVTVSNGR